MEVARPLRARSPGSPDKACCPLGRLEVSAAAVTIARRLGFSSCVVKRPTRILPFWRGCDLSSVGKTSDVSNVAWTPAPLG